MSDMEGFRLSPQQREVWSSEAGRGRPAQCAAWIGGPLRAEELRAALAALVERHEILRTGFRKIAGQKFPLQVIRDPRPPRWRESEAVDREAILEALAEEAAEPFDLEGGEGLRARLVRFPDGHALVLTVPALCADARGLMNLLGELAQLYAGASLDDPLQYVDAAEVLNDLLEAEDTRAARERWRAADPGSLPEPRFPLERPGSQGSVEPGSVAVPLPSGVTGDFLLAAWCGFLSRVSGELGIYVSAGFEGRAHEGLEEALGLFARRLPVLYTRSEGESARALAERMTATLREATQWQDYFSWDGRRSSGLGFELRELPERIAAGDLAIEPLMARLSPEPARLELVRAGRASKGAEIRFDPAAFSPDAARRLAASFRAFLAAAVAAPETPLDELELLDGEERAEVLGRFRSEGPSPETRPVHVLFAEQAARHPERTALVCGGERLTYAELSARANRLARHLRRRGVTEESTVALFLERSADAIVALLGVLQAGGAYVPLDPEAPASRLAYQIREAAPVAVVTESNLIERLPDVAAERICLDTDLETESAEPLRDEERLDRLAYVLYTSGSTGEPKGVAVTHGNLAAYTLAVCERLGLRENEPLGFACVSALNADLGNTAIFPSLVTGGCLHVFTHEEATDAGQFAARMGGDPIDVMKIVPSHLSALLAAVGSAVLPRRLLVLGGEKLTFDLAERIAKASPGLAVVNHYGPTETTVGSLTHAVGTALAGEPGSMPVGRPLPGTRIAVLDRSLRPVPVGASGELCIAGSGVARGYLGKAAETAERFVPDPFAESGGERMYRTGDLVRFLPDGRVEFVGRRDNQVKIRGHRVELGEVERSLARHPEVREAAVIARHEEGEARLVAYVVARSSKTPSATDLRVFLRQDLPEAMIPSAFVTLDTFPLNMNGKLDRKALPAPGREIGAAVYVAPRTPAETVLARIWSEVLGREEVGVEDNFFDLGGDSIVSIQIAARAAKEGLRFTPLQLFRTPTVAGLAGSATATDSTESPAEAPSAFRRVNLDQASLDKILRQVGAAGGPES